MKTALPTLADFQDWTNRRPRQDPMVFEAVQPFRVFLDAEEFAVFALGLGRYRTTLHGMALPTDLTTSSGRIAFLLLDLTRPEVAWENWTKRTSGGDWQMTWPDQNGLRLARMMIGAFAFIIEAKRDGGDQTTT